MAYGEITTPMVIPCNLPSPSDSPPYTSVSRGGAGALDASYDVWFVVGPPGDTWTIPGRRGFLATKCEALALVMRDTGSNVRLGDVDKRGFELLLRHLEGTDTKFTSLQTARSTLEVSCRFQCPDLTQRCVQHLDLQLAVGTVLEVYRDLARYCSNAHSCEPSAPEIGAEGLSQAQKAIQDWCSSLLHNCLLLIDTHCSDVITQEAFETLSYQDVSTIVSRDTLNLKSEFILYESLLRWYRCQCMKLGNKPENPTTRREILGELIFKVRFGLMQRSEFMTGPAQAGLFTSNEINEILNIIDNPNNIITDGRFRYINLKRKINMDEPRYLSDRTEPKNGKLKLKKEKGKGSNTLLNCLAVWTVLFD